MKTKQVNLTRMVLVFALVLTSLSQSYAQDTPIKSEDNIIAQGIIKDKNTPLEGATIHLEGTNIGVITDEKGFFKFPKALKKGDILLVSHLGMKTERLKIKDNSSFNVNMNVDLELDEIYITASAASKKVFSSKKQ